MLAFDVKWVIRARANADSVRARARCGRGRGPPTWCAVPVGGCVSGRLGPMNCELWGVDLACCALS